MLDKMTNQLNFHGNALVLRGERQRAIASNIANADTPGYVARDFKFGDALREATGVTSSATGTPGAAVTRLATTLSRCDCALMALPDTLKIENMDMGWLAFCAAGLGYWPWMALSMVLALPLMNRSVAS